MSTSKPGSAASKHLAEGNPADVLEKYLTDPVNGYGDVLIAEELEWLDEMRKYCNEKVPVEHAYNVFRVGKESGE